jgi:hypothetical protein
MTRVRFSARARYVYLLYVIQTASGTHFTILDTLPDSRAAEHEAAYSPPCSAEAKNGVSVPLLPHTLN